MAIRLNDFTNVGQMWVKINHKGEITFFSRSLGERRSSLGVSLALLNCFLT